MNRSSPLLRLETQPARRWPRVAGTALLMVAFGFGTCASAQFANLGTAYRYSASFICGTADPTRDVQSTGNAATSPYDDLEVGSYSTSLDVHNASSVAQTVTFRVAAQGLSTNLTIETVVVPPMQSRRFGCLNFMDDVQNNFPSATLFGRAIQGTVYFTQNANAIDLTATHTYSATQNDGDRGGGVSISVTRVAPREIPRRLTIAQ